MAGIIPVTTVWLQTDGITPEGSTRRKMFYCPYCKTPIAQFVGLIAMIVPGEPPVELPVEIQCGNYQCKARYAFQQIVDFDLTEYHHFRLDVTRRG